MLVAQLGRFVARRLARIGALPQAKVLHDYARRLLHDLDEHRHLVERANVFLIAAVRLGGGIVERLDPVGPQMRGQHRGPAKVVVVRLVAIRHNLSPIA